MKTPPINFEALALAKLVTAFDKALLLDLDASHFSGVYLPLFNIVLQHFSDTQRIPSLDTFEALALAKAPKAKLPVVTGIMQNLRKMNPDLVNNAEVVKGLLDKKLMLSMDSTVQALVQATLSKDVVETRNILNSIVEETNLHKAKPMDFAVAMDAPDTSKILPTGIVGLDEHLVGLAGLTIVAASSGAGKTAFLLQSALGLFQQGHSVLFISLELSAQVLGMRLKSLLTGIDFNKFITKSLTPEEDKLTKEALAALFSDPNKHFRLVTTPLDSQELMTMIKVEKALYNIDAVYLDYINLVQSVAGEEGWKSTSNVAKSLHRLSMSLGVTTITASQVNLDKAPKGGAYPQITTRGSAELTFSATLLIFLYKPPIEDSEGVQGIMLYVMKNRNAPQKQLLLEADFSKMRFDFIMEL